MGSEAGSIFHPLATNYSGSDGSTPRRLNVRALLEQGVRKTGSFRKALKLHYRTKRVDGDYKFFEQEAARFRKEFKRQARLNAKRMLRGSWDGIKEVLELPLGCPARRPAGPRAG